MPRLRYLNEADIDGLVAVLAADLFPGLPAFRLRGKDGRHRLLAALGQPRWPAYRTLPAKAAALHYSLNQGHPYIDGNKRLAVAALEAFVALNNGLLLLSNDELVDFGLGVASGRTSREATQRLLDQRIFRTSWTRAQQIEWVRDITLDDWAPVLADGVTRSATVRGRLEALLA